jgi:histidyl-tRNA synthetase
VRHVLFQGEPERQSGQVALKDMISGTQWLLPEEGWLAALLEQRAAD